MLVGLMFLSFNFALISVISAFISNFETSLPSSFILLNTLTAQLILIFSILVRGILLLMPDS